MDSRAHFTGTSPVVEQLRLRCEVRVRITCGQALQPLAKATRVALKLKVTTQAKQQQQNATPNLVLDSSASIFDV